MSRTNANVGGDVFPSELFGHIVDIIAEKPEEVSFTKEQIETLRSCALVCKNFLSLCRSHLFRCAIFGLDGKLDELLELLEHQPSIGGYIREIAILLEGYNWLPLTELYLERSTQILADLPNVNSISILYSSYQIDRLTPQHDVGSFCNSLIQAYGAQGGLQNVSVKKMSNLPFSAISSCGTLTSLSLDRCDLPLLTEPIPTIKKLTLRKIDAPASVLSYFPNLDELNLLRCELKKSNESSNLPFPSFGIQRLSIEWCHSWGGDISLLGTAPLLQYYRDQAAHEGIEPFEQVASLGLVFDGKAEFSEAISLLKETKALQHVSFETCPPAELTTLELVNHLRHQGLSISLRHQPVQYPVQTYDRRPISHLSLARSTTSFLNTIPLDGLLTHPAFSEDAKKVESNITMASWSRCVSTLLEHREGFKKLEEVEIRIMLDCGTIPGVSNFVTVNSDGFDGAAFADKIANRHGVVIGTYLDDFDRSRWSKAVVIFLTDA